jgi:hypothetical protein
MQVKMVIFPEEDGLDVVLWAKWTQGSMRVRHFDNRTSMIATLGNLGLLSPQEAQELESFVFTNYCPIYSSEIDEEILTAHGFCQPR